MGLVDQVQPALAKSRTGAANWPGEQIANLWGGEHSRALSVAEYPAGLSAALRGGIHQGYIAIGN